MAAFPSAQDVFPEDGTAGTLAARVFRPDVADPSVVAIRAECVFDISDSFPMMSALATSENPASALKAAPGTRIGSLDELLGNTEPGTRDGSQPWLLAPNIVMTGATQMSLKLGSSLPTETSGRPNASVTGDDK